MCEGRVLFMVDRDGVEGVCGEHEVLLVGLLMRPRSDCGRSYEQVNDLYNFMITYSPSLTPPPSTHLIATPLPSSSPPCSALPQTSV